MEREGLEFKLCSSSRLFSSDCAKIDAKVKVGKNLAAEITLPYFFVGFYIFWICRVWFFVF